MSRSAASEIYLYSPPDKRDNRIIAARGHVGVQALEDAFASMVPASKPSSDKPDSEGWKSGIDLTGSYISGLLKNGGFVADNGIELAVGLDPSRLEQEVLQSTVIALSKKGVAEVLHRLILPESNDQVNLLRHFPSWSRAYLIRPGIARDLYYAQSSRPTSPGHDLLFYTRHTDQHRGMFIGSLIDALEHVVPNFFRLVKQPPLVHPRVLVSQIMADNANLGRM